MSPDRPVLTVDLDRVVANWRGLGNLDRALEVGAVLKADAYGVGADPIARALVAAGCRTLFVATWSEAVALQAGLRDAAATLRVFVLHGITGRPDGPGVSAPADIAWAAPILNHRAEAQALSALARRQGRRLVCGLHIDTGMNRLGLTLEDALALADDPDADGLAVEIVMSHLACADEPSHPLNSLQTARFLEVLSLLRRHWPDARSSLDNSAGAHLGGGHRFDLARPGIALLGANPVSPSPSPVRTALTLTAPLLQVREALPGETVGYGAGHELWRPRRLGVAAIGYADGVLRACAAGGYAVLRGVRTPIVGRVSMDLLTLDVTECAPAAEPGDRVELFGPNRPLEAAAAAAGTLPYELLTRLGPRVARVHLVRREAVA